MWVRQQKSNLVLFPCSVCHNSLTLSLSGAGTILFKGEHFIARVRGGAVSLWEPESGFVSSLGFASSLPSSYMFQLSWKRRAGNPSFMWMKGTYFFRLVSSESSKNQIMGVWNWLCMWERGVAGRVHPWGQREEPGVFPVGLFCMLNHLLETVLERNTLLLGIPMCH